MTTSTARAITAVLPWAALLIVAFCEWPIRAAVVAVVAAHWLARRRRSA